MPAERPPDPAPATPDVTLLLAAAREGERAAVDAVFAAVYAELRRIAHGQLRRTPHGATLRTTAIVHEAYLKLVRHESVRWEDRGHFFAVAALAMRQILVSYARRFLAEKRGAGAQRVTLEDVEIPVEERAAELLALDEALARLAERDPRLAQVVELRFFAGLSVEETAQALGIGERTVKRDWQFARTYLHRELHGAAS